MEVKLNPRHRPYPSYRDAGISWLGKLPEHWETKRFKFVSRLAYGDSLAADNREDGNIPVFGSNGIVDTHKIANTQAPCLIIGRKGSYGKVNFSDVPSFAIDTTYFIDPTTTQSDIRYLFYALPLLKLDESSQDTGVPGLSREFAYNQWLPIPPFHEQRFIASYLDRETSQIDALIAKKQRLLELLAEKRSALISQAVTKGLNPEVETQKGNNWIDKYPKDWIGTTLKRWVTTKITDGPHETPEFIDEGIPFVSAEAVYNDKINFDSMRGYISLETHKRYCQKLKPQRNDIFMIKSGATTGKLAIVDTDIAFSVWSPMTLIRVDGKDITPKYLFLALHSDYIQNQVRQLWTQGTQPNISMSEVENIFVVAPSVKEQNEITNYLDKETEKLNDLSVKIEFAIESLNEYRSALISSAVTGKIDLRET